VSVDFTRHSDPHDHLFFLRTSNTPLVGVETYFPGCISLGGISGGLLWRQGLNEVAFPVLSMRYARNVEV
jgi:hypothetical protein